MKVAVVAETAAGERRVAATPETVKKLIALGAHVAVEANAGREAAIADTELSVDTQRLIRECYQSVRSGHDQWEQIHKGITAS